MKEERKARDMREKIKENKEKRGKKGDDNPDQFPDQSCEQIGNYKIYIDKLIGEGTYGRVYKARHSKTNELFACKAIFKKKLQDLKMYREEYAKELEERFKTESEFHKKLSGQPHIVNLVDTIENNKAFYFIMEYCESDLSKIIRENGILTQEVALRYFTQMVEGYRSIYLNNAFHRDLKPQNLLVKEDSIKISDFGFVKIFSDMDYDKECRTGKNKLRTQSKVGSIKYMAPDVLGLASQNSGSSTYNAQKSDIWSMGIILYKMLYGKQPFSGRDQEQMMKVISQKELSFPDSAKIGPEIIKKAEVSEEVIELMKLMIEKNEEKRIGFKKLEAKLKSLNEDRKNKKVRGPEESTNNNEGDSSSLNNKQKLLMFYKKIMDELYRDAVNYASLRQFGIQNYHEVSMKLITFIHEKRTNQIENQDLKQYVNENIKQDISTFHNHYFTGIKKSAKLEEGDTLEKVILQVFSKIKTYSEDQQPLMKEVLVLITNLLLFISLQLKACDLSFVMAQSMKLSESKVKKIMKFWHQNIENIDKKLKGEVKEEDGEEKEEKKQKKQKKHHNHHHDSQQNEKSTEKTKQDKHHKKSKDKSKDKHKSKDKKSKKEDK